jgi:hypothetical protein
MSRLVEPENLIEIYRTAHGAVLQSNRYHHYVLEFGGSASVFKVRDFFLFRRCVEEINLDEMVQSTSPAADVCVLMPCYTDRCFVLTVNDVLNLTEILRGANFMINLNSMVQETLRGNIAPSYLD